MAKSRLHELSAGVSVWIDSLSRELLESGELARLMKEDAVVGVTSNPTIFQKALAEGDWYDEQLREVAAPGRPDRDLLRACDGRHPRGLRPAAPRLGADRGHRRLRLARGRPDARIRPRATFEQAIRLHERGRPAEPLREDPGDAARPRRDRGLHREGHLDQRHADLLARALRGGGRGVHARARAARRRRRRPEQVSSVASFFVSRVDTEADRRLDEIGGQATTAGQARDREREARLPALPGDVLRPALGVPRRQGRDAATLPLGLDLDEEPGLPRRPLRRGADRAGHREHDAGRDGRGLPGSRRGRGRRSRGRRRARSCSSGSRRPASTTTTSSRRSRPRACRSSPTRSTSCSTGSAPSGPSSPRRDGRSSSGSGRTTPRSGPTRARTAGSAGSTSSRASACTSTS